MSQYTFAKATKSQVKARLALCGPTGAGKTWTALDVAAVLGERRVLIDTERGSGALYADQFDYDYFRFDPPYDPGRLVEVLKAADAEGYDLVIVDSLSHFWEGEGGTLDIVDAAASRSMGGNTYAGWKIGTPALRHLVDTLLGLDAGLIVTMRSKMEYVLETNAKGKQVPVKVGMAPVMRNGVEYEFTLVGDLDLDHRITISKTRCSVLADQVIQPGRGREMAETFAAWLNSGEPVASREQIEQVVTALNGIADRDDRARAKNVYVDAWGKPDHLLASQFAGALAFAQELASPVDPAGDPPTPSPAADGDPGPTEPEGLPL